MPFSSDRFRRLYELKGIKQEVLAGRIGVSQPQISSWNRGGAPSTDVLEKIADALDSTTDFLLGRGSKAVDESEDLFRAVTSRMAYDVFAARLNVGNEQRRRCHRVLGHPLAPLTADAWGILSEQIDLAIGPDSPGLQIITGGA